MATDDEIRALCVLALQVKNGRDFEKIVGKLSVSLNQRLLQIENLATYLLLNSPKQKALVFDKSADKIEDKIEEK